MGMVRVHEFITLDGSISAPMWTMDYGFTDEMGESIGAMTQTCSAILLGRETYEMFAQAWPSRTVEDDPGAPFFNETPKYVVSSTLEHGDWNPTTVLGGYDPDTIRDLKAKVDGDIYVSGSATLVRAMIADGLVDDLNLIVYPLTVGVGPWLFPAGAGETRWTLTKHRGFDNGVAHLAYSPAS